MKNTKRQKVRKALLEYFERNGEHEFFGSHLTTHIRNKTTEFYIYTDTILRYCRQLKQEGKDCKEEIQELRESKNCPTCGQVMTKEHLEHVNIKIKEIEERMFKGIAPQIKGKVCFIPELDGRVTDLTKRIDVLNTNIHDNHLF